MSTLPSLTDELAAVNSMLNAIGETHVNTLEGANVVDVAIARSLLAEVNRKMQVKGWHFNSEVDYPLAADIAGEVFLPANCLRVDASGFNHPTLDVVSRGNRLYDRNTHSFNIGKTIKADIVLLLPLDELPEVARQYVMVRATRLFGNRMLGDVTLDGFTAADEVDALVTLKEAEGDTADWNIFDSADTSAALRR